MARRPIWSCRSSSRHAAATSVPWSGLCALRTVVTDTRPGGDWAIRRVAGRHTLATPPALEVLARAGIVAPLAAVADAGDGDDWNSWYAAPWRAALTASAQDLRADGLDRNGRLAREIAPYFRNHLFDRPLASYETLLRWQLATSRATSDVVRANPSRAARGTPILPDIERLFEALECPDFGTRPDVAAAIASQILTAPPDTYAALSDRYMAAMDSGELVRRALLPAASAVSPRV